MNLDSYISQLLYRYQCVIVPGFGAFLTETQSAQWVASANSFFPPKKLVSFNTNLKNNDGLLANHIAATEKTSYNYAVNAIEYEVAKWKKALENKDVLVLKNIGTLSTNADNNLVFRPSEQENFLTSSFGLASFVSPVVKRTIFEQKTENIATTNTTLSLETPVLESNPRSSYLKYAAIFVLGLGLAGTLGYPIYQNELATQSILVERSVQKQVENKIQEATFFIQNPMPAVTLAIQENKLPYHVVAGAFREEKNANKIYQKLVKKGYDSKLLEVNKHGLYPVVYGSYATLAEAEKAKRDIQQHENAEAWVLIESL
ncbi:SPOR domain-containing protein [Flavobacterium crassostreae]|uniref:Sporulation protein n=1 Tax=Flavobacterium crassostreae TaxID=1763534 RepID=A0A1B9E5E5_9FLAO|nr:SPOR domain-containing protein [Flavobacterium crassostreae]OCB77184.1 sporulation protein [Flavobacterium crassostreae]